MTIRIAGSTGLLGASGAPFLGGASDRPAEWERQLRILWHHGFRDLDVSEMWLFFTGLDEHRRRDLVEMIGDIGFNVVGVSLVGGIRLADPETAEAEYERVCTALEFAQALGAAHLSYTPRTPPPVLRSQMPLPASLAEASSRGPHRTPFTEAQAEVLADGLRGLVREGRGRGIRMCVEMNEITLDTAAAVRDLLDRVGEPDLGVNPDLGNLLRAPWALPEHWSATIEGVADRISYWHVKSGYRVEPAGGPIVHHPCPLELGTINYRHMLWLALRAGFDGPIVIEHYGGDALGIATKGLPYLRALLDDLEAYGPAV
ncbi:MAG: sugar phosphate isomerase/epimerase family protein [Protaetiibacter sp.]